MPYILYDNNWCDEQIKKLNKNLTNINLYSQAGKKAIFKRSYFLANNPDENGLNWKLLNFKE